MKWKKSPCKYATHNNHMWLRPDMTEKLLTGTLSLNTNKIIMSFSENWTDFDTNKNHNKMLIPGQQHKIVYSQINKQWPVLRILSINRVQTAGEFHRD